MSPCADRARSGGGGTSCGVGEALAAREQRSERRRVRAARAVRRSDRRAARRESRRARAVEEMVDRVVAVPAGDDRGARAQLVQPLRQLSPRRVETGERPRLEQVRRHDRRQREQPPDQRFDRVVLEQLRAGARDHDGVDDERHRVLLEIVGDRLDHGAREEHPRLRGIDADVVEHCVELLRARRRAAARGWRSRPTVFCAVSATSTDVPYAPAAANAFRSAWMPAPPPESDVAIVSARGTVKNGSLRRY